MNGHHKIRLLALMVLLMFSASSAYAHKVNMFAFVEGDEVFVEGYFADGKRAMKSEVQVLDSQMTVLIQGLTDDEGQYSFKIPKKEDLKIVINAGMGHKAEYLLSRTELGGDDGLVASVETVAADMNGPMIAATSNTTAVAGIDEAQLKALVKKAVGESIRPLVRTLSELKEQKSFSDIVGGLGFIVGLMGIFFYYKARKLSQG